MEKTNKCGLHCIKAENISVKIGNDEIIKNVNIHIHCGQLTVIIGRNGAGKSTLLKALLGEVKHTGKIEIYDKKENKYEKLKIGYVPQSMNIERHMPTTVYDLIAGIISNKPIWLKKDKKIYEKIKEHLKVFEADLLIDKSIGDLSGGELQPVSGSDKNGIRLFFDLINKQKTEHDMAIILVSHDLDMVRKYADKVILLDKTVIKQGTPDEVFRK